MHGKEPEALMTRVVRMNRRVYRQAQLDTHYESYRNVFPHEVGTFVPGDGDPLSRIVIVGEAPGAEEDRLGKPFIGPSGNLLSKWLKSVGLNRRNVFVTNLLKQRPPNNADPTNEQASAAVVLMRWELLLLKPEVVVTLGRFATSVFYPNPRISTLSGTCRKKDYGPTPDSAKTWVVPIFHPSAALRSSSTRRLAAEHFQVVQQFV